MKVNQFNKIVQKLRKGFKVVEKGSDHYDYELYTMDGTKLIGYFRRSMSLKDSHDVLIARNLHMNMTSLKEFIRCTYSCDEYIEDLKRKNHF
jgi:hypothetical protein